MPYISMILVFFFIFSFASGPGTVIIPDYCQWSKISVSLLPLWITYDYSLLHCIQSCLCSWPLAGVTAPLPGELFTQSFKSAGYTLACTINWTGLFVLGMLFPVIVVWTFFSWQSFAMAELHWKCCLDLKDQAEVYLLASKPGMYFFSRNATGQKMRLCVQEASGPPDLPVVVKTLWSDYFCLQSSSVSRNVRGSLKSKAVTCSMKC